ncbi:MAG: rRNA maturation RNase YbeY [Candidatus Omnitrophica bacterium]|nr:rRNA maturation RNase YbeY [Candidatus Omnitrophota bacterium]
MIKINVQNLNKKRRVRLRQVKALSSFVVKKVGKNKELKINIVFLSDNEIKTMNKKFKNKNITTDVLCFCMFEGSKLKGQDTDMGTDIYISSDTAFREAKKYNMTYTSELYFYVVHGLLHMLGMDDSSEQLRAQMHKKQNELIDEFYKKLSKKEKVKR